MITSFYNLYRSYYLRMSPQSSGYASTSLDKKKIINILINILKTITVEKISGFVIYGLL